MTTSNINYNERIRYSIFVLILYIILITFGGIDVPKLMVIIYSFIQLLLCLKQKIKPISRTIFNIIISILLVICMLPTFIFLFNQTFILTWEHYIIIILSIYAVIDQFISIKSEPCMSLPYVCLLTISLIVW